MSQERHLDRASTSVTSERSTPRIRTLCEEKFRKLTRAAARAHYTLAAQVEQIHLSKRFKMRRARAAGGIVIFGGAYVANRG